MARPLTRARVGRFELIHRFAIGGMGEIFLARERGIAGFDRQVVVKLLIPELAEQADLVTLFIDEARIAANLTHPNIVQIFDFGRDDSGYFLAMEYVPGQNLARICARAVRDERKLLGRELAVHIVAEMARGLDHAHHACDSDGKPLGIVHRDVSPHNLLLSIHGDVKLMDFGIAMASNTLHRTATGVIRGKFGYMSPEQLAGQPVDVTTDVYSAGVVLWELTLMRRLWPGQDDLAVLDQARAGKVPRPREIDPTYPADLEEIVMHAVERDRSQRTASAGALAADLRGWLALQGAVIERSELGAVVTKLFPEIDHVAPARGEAEPEPQTASLPEPTTTTAPAMPRPSPPLVETAPPPRPPRRRAWIAFAAVSVIAGGVLAIAVLGHRDPDAPSPPPPVTAIAAPPAADASSASAASDASAAPPPDDAGSSAPATTATTPTRPTANPRKRKDTAPPPRPAIDTTPSVTATPPVAAPAPGILIVESTPWGTVSLPGHAPDQTPRRLKLAPGDYPITVTFAEGGGTITGTATVTSNATTKCRGTAAGLACGR